MAKAKPQAPDEKLNSSDMVREMLNKGLEKNAEIKQAIKDEHKTEVKDGLIYAVKAGEKKKNGTPADSSVAKKPKMTGATGDLTPEELTEVAKILGMVGTERLKTFL